jgi:hypothetical protein
VLRQEESEAGQLRESETRLQKAHKTPPEFSGSVPQLLDNCLRHERRTWAGIQEISESVPPGPAPFRYASRVQLNTPNVDPALPRTRLVRVQIRPIRYNCILAGTQGVSFP